MVRIMNVLTTDELYLKSEYHRKLKIKEFPTKEERDANNKYNRWYRKSTEERHANAKKHSNLWKANNPEKTKEHHEKWASENPEKVMKARLKYEKDNKEKIKRYRKRYYRKRKRLENKELQSA